MIHLEQPLKQLGLALLLSTLLLPQAVKANPYQVDFGNFFTGNTGATAAAILPESAPVSDTLIGCEFIWSCLDPSSPLDAGFQYLTFNLTNDPDILTDEAWSSNIELNSDRIVIFNAIKNAYQHNRSVTHAPADDMAFHYVVWAIVESCKGGNWSGTLDLSRINSIIDWPENEEPILSECASLIEGDRSH